MFGPEHFQRNLAAVEELRPLAAKYGKSLPQFALRWTLSNPVVGTALVGFRTAAEVVENLGALGWEISNADMAEVDAILTRHGAVTVPHGSRLRLPLATDAEHEWRRVEPQIMRIIAQGPADAEGQTFTPVRTGEEKLRLEYKRLNGDAPAERAVTYDVSVPEETGIFSRFWARVRGKSSS